MVGVAAACTNVDAEDIDLVKLGALEKEFIVEADANSFDIDIYTNGAYHIERINESDWLSLACGETTDGKATITAECEFNEDFSRRRSSTRASHSQIPRSSSPGPAARTSRSSRPTFPSPTLR